MFLESAVHCQRTHFVCFGGAEQQHLFLVNYQAKSGHQTAPVTNVQAMILRSLKTKSLSSHKKYKNYFSMEGNDRLFLWLIKQQKLFL